MYADIDEQVVIARDCEATLIPFGNKITLKKGEEGHITQALGGSYTVMIRGNLVRVEGKDADAIGKIPEVQPWLEEIETDGRANEKAVWDAMKTCYDPEIPVNVVDLGLIYSCDISDEDEGGSFVDIKMTLTAPGCGMGDMIASEVKQKIAGVPGTSDVRVELVWDPPWDRGMITESARLQLGML
ncbi:MAG: putative Fe-S cluster assembly protein SufT [Candidatus Marinimicrobia bacterium]|jgi:probable FeS assembly SUF system protein SufT|nr:putative Fe-S cluster assembly protein SufT [Candidatus Neomarinimicrobiota bacterium]MBT3675703.1 putative Fe-S cluster assembly protein SufT [Candidatus Neomarinimicrobiota bacterium]MBT3763743.1 putative Fe-S cluster assembly protein SufT [Candidatus Neomarinimicrobiota bacterium]MBT4067124.1 putative Fe-S cluster assembly protein SufT [Candidatus Neomarinimicrobiota bacterium]MBT4271046.1 putative Fe-S cluster assembly protein SufT [Candidatus Neomarinimicrobiota bacterium]